ncbi:Haloacid Dehalogenase superfamily, subfamily IB, phosphoserine phosphatase-like/2,3-diketo-5-methylthio-1-phosphopentane phosphatase [Natronincola peptidivorans]|uniref:Haloacid Dehalogenase superfamily, subfamily IB, phosphoserine phosphatase-like/2,3-diketo-5-methylthio-1-phosphopentane phosphatase n=1 Tax=Natronincola peptidivorans TaxID=426128 RepID=A0A1H9Y5C4_9FIRM|nr:MtnX-like HAD-IB family phosphatase [Natronincola peptidivorans]SES64052.1 Haloacid Dehalogenase superfamily, subfamily IB, phosphoserine phosphatase-like/2,3-diketo-5-methylthio-1-phosphopentane phosphatase [Natronincola peptidivorans]
MEKIKPVFFVDFDGTITKQDVCETIVKKFAGEGWEDINKKWESKELSTIECARETFKLFTRTDEEAFKEVADTIQIDESFQTFVSFCRENDYNIYILSDGYDYYIQYILDRKGISLPFYANRLIFSSEIEVEAPYQAEDCQLCGVCKTALMRKLKKNYETAVYIGDGYSDFCPTKTADYVFAKNKLYDYCLSIERKVYLYESFQDILDQIHLIEKEVKA